MSPKRSEGAVPLDAPDEGLFRAILPVCTAASIHSPVMALLSRVCFYDQAAFPPVVRPAFACCRYLQSHIQITLPTHLMIFKSPLQWR